MRLRGEVRERIKTFAAKPICLYGSLPKLQEADASQRWLGLVKEECGIVEERLSILHQEVDELIAIFTTIIIQVRKSG